MITIIETQQFTSNADKIISAVEKDDLFDFIGRNPKEGVVISGTGGVRKLRFAIPVSTLKKWETNNRVPEGPTKAYLMVIEKNPHAVKKALHSAI